MCEPYGQLNHKGRETTVCLKHVGNKRRLQPRQEVEQLVRDQAEQKTAGVALTGEVKRPRVVDVRYVARFEFRAGGAQRQKPLGGGGIWREEGRVIHQPHRRHRKKGGTPDEGNQTRLEITENHSYGCAGLRRLSLR